jgi:hypothetical protein
MAVYIIRGEAVTAHRSAPELLSAGEVVIGSAEEPGGAGLAEYTRPLSAMRPSISGAGSGHPLRFAVD